MLVEYDIKGTLIAGAVTLIMSVTSYAQTGFHKLYGTFNSESCSDILITPDSGYIAVGYSMNTGAGSQDVCLVKMDKGGNLQWSKNYGGLYQEVGNSVALTQDGGYVICGNTNSFGAGFDDVYLIRTDSIGNMIWVKAFGGANSERAQEVAATSDGGFVVVGGTYLGAGSSDAFLLKVDGNGDQVFLKTYGGTGYEEAFSVIEMNDGSFGIAGTMTSFGAGGEDIYFVKTDNKGNKLWSRTYGGDGWDRASAIRQTTDGGFIIAGLTESFSMQKHYALQCYLMKLDTFGAPQWSAAFGKLASENIAFDVAQGSDGGYCVVGYSGNFSGDYRSYAIKTDAAGSLEWSKISGDGALNSFTTVEASADGGFMIGGYTNGFGNLTQFLLVRTDDLGYNKCNMVDSVTYIHDTLPLLSQPGDTVIDVNFSDTVAGVETIVIFEEILLCSNLCNVVADFSLTDSIYCKGDTLFLTSTSTGAGTVEWLIEGQLYSDTTDTFYIADSLGIYTFLLVADSQFCQDSIMYDITIGDTVQSDFTFTINDLTTDFSESTQYASSFMWYFGTGDVDSTGNPSYTYLDTGLYTVCLVATNNCSLDSTCYPVYVNCPYPIVGYTYIVSDLAVNFTNTSVLADSYYWIFGDGNASSDTNATHTYATAGTYEVCLIATNSCGPSDLCVDITVTGNTTAIDEHEAINAQIYMNYETNHIVLKLDRSVHRVLSLKMTNAVGQNLVIDYGQSSDGMSYEIEANTIAPGIYFITLNSGRLSLTEKIVITR